MQFGSLCFETAEPLGRIGLNGHELMSSHVELVLEIVIIDSKTTRTHQNQPNQPKQPILIVFCFHWIFPAGLANLCLNRISVLIDELSGLS